MIRYIEKGYGLHEAIAAAGHWLAQVDGTWQSSDDAAVQAIIDSYDPLPQMRDALFAEVAAARIARQSLGTPYTFPDGQVGTIQTRDGQDLLNINGIVTRAMMAQAAGVTDPVFEFRDEENRTHNLTATDVLALGVAVSSFVEGLYRAKWAHDSAITAWQGGTQYDTSAGWPGV